MRIIWRRRRHRHNSDGRSRNRMGVLVRWFERHQCRPRYLVELCPSTVLACRREGCGLRRMGSSGCRSRRWRFRPDFTSVRTTKSFPNSRKPTFRTVSTWHVVMSRTCRRTVLGSGRSQSVRRRFLTEPTAYRPLPVFRNLRFRTLWCRPLDYLLPNTIYRTAIRNNPLRTTITSVLAPRTLNIDRHRLVIQLKVKPCPHQGRALRLLPTIRRDYPLSRFQLVRVRRCRLP